MTEVFAALGAQSPAVLIASALAVVALLVLLVWQVVLRTIFRRNLEAVLAAPELADRRLRDHYRKSTILMRSRLIERIARRGNREIVALSGVDRLWIRRLGQRRRVGDARRVVELAPDAGLFTCFVAALHRPRVAAVLRKWLTDSGDLVVLRRVAMSGHGESFDGVAAHSLFSDRIDEVREMIGDPEWKVRYFAVKIILHDHTERSERALWDAYNDAHRLVRRTVVHEFHPADTGRQFTVLHDLYLHDPVFEVRREARTRIATDFPDQLRLHPTKLSDVEAFHIVQLLQPNSHEDEAVAFRYLESRNRELRLPAAIYLEETGALSRIFREASLGDREAFERSERQLNSACEVNVVGFLSSVNLENPACLFLAARLLKVTGDSSRLLPVAERVFQLPPTESAYREIYVSLLDAIAARGGDSALEALRGELHRSRNDETKLTAILERIPARAESIFAPSLLALLADDEVAAREQLEAAMVSLPTATTLPALLKILQDGRDNHSHRVRMSALRVIGGLKLEFCLQYLMENLSTLRPEDAREFTATIAGFSGKAFDERARQILDGPDSITRAALILSLPATGKKEYLKTIRESLLDADPDVRVASVWALHLYGETRLVNQALDLLRDPVERVRREAATVLGEEGTPGTLEKIRALVTDENEVVTVKLSAIGGLGRSQDKKSISLLVQLLVDSAEWDEPIIAALSAKQTRKQITVMVEQMKDAEPRVRTKISRAFRAMGANGEASMVDLLREDLASLRPTIAGVLEELGFVEATIRRLAHRDPVIRREAAGILSAVGTLPAFRGIVLAARDPDPEVRVQVIRALEKLATESGKDILEGLQNDPDRRVRKYTLWALERIRSKSL